MVVQLLTHWATFIYAHSRVVFGKVKSGDSYKSGYVAEGVNVGNMAYGYTLFLLHSYAYMHKCLDIISRLKIYQRPKWHLQGNVKFCHLWGSTEHQFRAPLELVITFG